MELHRLRKTLEQVGLRAFPHGQDPLELPELIELDGLFRQGVDEPLQGLDDLSFPFQSWLEHQRDKLSPEQTLRSAPLRQELVESLARQMALPYLIILKGPPGAGRHSFVRSLANRMDLPLINGVTGPSRSVHLINGHEQDAHHMADPILASRDGVWAVTLDAFSRESELALRLRHAFPAERTRYLEFRGLDWHEVRTQLLNHLPFTEAARIFIRTCGHLGYINELLKLRPAEGFEDELPVPQKIRAAYSLQKRELPEEAQSVLDHMSVHPGPLSDVMLRRFGFTTQLDTLEMSGWLQYQGDWVFTDETARRVIYATLHSGRKLHYHKSFAVAFMESDVGEMLSAAYHRAMAGEERSESIDSDRIAGACAPWVIATLGGDVSTGAQVAPTYISVAPGRERALLLERHAAMLSSDNGVTNYWTRQPQCIERSLAEYLLPDEPSLLVLNAKVHAESVFGVGLRCNAYPLAISFYDGDAPDVHVIFADVGASAKLCDGTLLLPLQSDLRVAFVCSHRTLRLETRSEAGIVEFSLQAHALKQGHGPGQAIDLRA